MPREFDEYGAGRGVVIVTPPWYRPVATLSAIDEGWLPMLIIRHLTGPLAGTETRIEPHLDRVMFGRQLDCQIAYPPDATIVARHHFALMRKASGDWTFDLFGAPYVAVNGVAADPGAKLPNGAVIELGKRGGPSFKVLIERDARTDNMPPTEVQAEVVSARTMARWATRIAAAGAVVAVAAGAGAGYYYYRGSSDAARLERAIKGIADTQASDANLRIGSDVRTRLPRSVYLVLVRDAQGRERGAGTAWPVAPHLLGTNGHVAEIGDALAQGENMVVRAPGIDGKAYTVTEHRIHPGYREFKTFLNNDSVFLQAFRGGNEEVGFNLAAYDVALLRVNEDLPAPDILELATADELKALSTGGPLGTAGYPMEGIAATQTQVIRASPEFHVGTLTGLTDFFSLPAEFEQRRMVHHDLPATGGQSGSPIAGASGRVVALLNSGNIIIQQGGKRAPSAALINYAQRSDLLGDLMSGEAQTKLDADQKYWANQMTLFKRGIDLIIPKILAESKPSPSATPALVSDQRFTLSAQSRDKNDQGEVQRLRSHAVPLANGTTYTFIAYGLEKADIDLYLIIGGECISPGQKTGNRCVAAKDKKWFPSIVHTAVADAEALLYVATPQDRDITYSLRIYRWEPNSPTG